MKKYVIMLSMLLLFVTFAFAHIDITATVISEFDSMSNFAPFSPITIYSARAPFSVTASDSNGVSFCTFSIYKNNLKVLDINALSPNESGNGVWSYIYTDLDRGDSVYSKVFCVDKVGNISDILQSSVYNASSITFDIGMNNNGGSSGNINLSPLEDTNNAGITAFFPLGNSVEGKDTSIENIGIFFLFILVLIALYFILKNKF